MKKKKFLSKTPTIFEMKKHFLFDMIDVYLEEKDFAKREKMRQSISEYILANKEIAIDKFTNSYYLHVGDYLEDEQKDIVNQLKNFKINFCDLALVSVKSNFEEKISSITSKEFSRLFKDYKYFSKISKDFDKEIIWEMAILRKDRKSFVLLRDILDKKVQPIENCVIWANSTIDKLKKDTKYDKGELFYCIDYFPNLFTYWVKDINKFTDWEKKNGVLAENLYLKNIDCINEQMKSEMSTRVEKYKKQLEIEERKEIYNSRETFEF